MWKFCENVQFPQSFGKFTKLCRNCAFQQNFHTRKSGEITVFYAVKITIKYLSMEENLLLVRYSFLFKKAR